MTAATTDAIVELIPDRVFRLGGIIPIDDRLTWAAPGSGIFDAVNSYLIVEDRDALLIDTGISIHKESLGVQLDSLRPRFDQLRVFTTRFEPDCIINLDLLIKEFGITGVYGGSVHNPFDLFVNLAPEEVVRATYEIEVNRVRPGERLTVGTDRPVDMFETMLRVLPTFWLHDTSNRTLFTSDSFGHAHLDSATNPPIVFSPDELPSVEDIRAHLMQKFDWFASANPDELRGGLHELFDTYDFDIIAPTHGAITVGADTVRRHYELLDAALETITTEPGFR